MQICKINHLRLRYVFKCRVIFCWVLRTKPQYDITIPCQWRDPVTVFPHSSPLPSFYFLHTKVYLVKKRSLVLRHSNTQTGVCIRDGRFGSKVGQIGPKWDKSGAFSDQISVHLAPRRQIHWNLIWKSPGFVPFGANLTHFGGKPTIPVRHLNLL